MIPGMILAIFGAIYTAFLFSQARARDLWQSPIFSAVHMLVHALMAGSVVMMLILPGSMTWMTPLLEFSILFNILLISKEILLPHDTPDSRKTIELMTKGYYSKYFWAGIIIGSVAPIILLNAYPSLTLIAGEFAIVGIFLTEFVRIRVPQMIPLS
jgi:formate-dependent nitrite reductase membrane component NrfD